MSRHNCPRCGSENTSTFAMIHSGGTSTGSFGAVSYGLNAGLIGTKGKTNSQSLLAQQTAPPHRPGYGAGIYLLAAFCGLVVVGAINSILHIAYLELIPVVGFLIFIAGSVCSYFLLNQLQSGKISDWHENMKIWNRSWMCLKCGSTFFSEV